MENEDVSIRVANMENQLAQLTALMAEISRKISEPPAPAIAGTSTPVLSGPTPPLAGEPHVTNPAEKVTPVIVNLDPPPKQGSAIRFDEENASRLAKMEELLCVLKGYEMKGVDKLTPYAKVKVPENFKEPEFMRKYDGTGCPITHLKYYMRRMARYFDNVPLLIHTFQDSLDGPALSWFIALDIEELTGWDDLADEFLQQYKFNSEIVPTREELGLVYSGCQTFSQLVEVGEGVEWAIIDGRISTGNSKKFTMRKDKETAVEVAFIQEPAAPKSVSMPSQNPRAMQGNGSQGFDGSRKFPRKEFTPLPRPLSKLLPILFEKRLVAKEVPRDNPPRFPGFDITKTYEYHMGERGHDVDNCYTLKLKVQNLLDKGKLTFKEATPNVQQNPLPDHTEGVNVILEEMQANE
ncbi:uncharacterized protein LOC120296239 [Eucalyptus grandis]|uniref:uncharacterized protein LOC120296239 n=1 Tax=Eucalyptus grandis TaxID=71139 RepID=UPI00192E9797|nr:uncharacterized protein LOC120296239 [Eucalyptus grandis]